MEIVILINGVARISAYLIQLCVLFKTVVGYLCLLSSVVEQLFCKQQVASPNLAEGSSWGGGVVNRT